MSAGRWTVSLRTIAFAKGAVAAAFEKALAAMVHDLLLQGLAYGVSSGSSWI